MLLSTQREIKSVCFQDFSVYGLVVRNVLNLVLLRQPKETEQLCKPVDTGYKLRKVNSGWGS